MKFNLMIIILVSLALANMFEKTIAQKNGEKNSTIMDVIQNIVNDPEFLALDPRQQLHVLLVMYDILDRYYKSSMTRQSDEKVYAKMEIE